MRLKNNKDDCWEGQRLGSPYEVVEEPKAGNERFGEPSINLPETEEVEGRRRRICRQAWTQIWRLYIEGISIHNVHERGWEPLKHSVTPGPPNIKLLQVSRRLKRRT